MPLQTYVFIFLNANHLQIYFSVIAVCNKTNKKFFKVIQEFFHLTQCNQL